MTFHLLILIATVFFAKALPPGMLSVTQTKYTDSNCTIASGSPVCHILGQCFSVGAGAWGPAGSMYGIYAYLPTGGYNSEVYTFSEIIFWDSACSYVEIPFTVFSDACEAGSCCLTTESALLSGSDDVEGSQIVTQYAIYNPVQECSPTDPIDGLIHSNIGASDDFKYEQDDFHHPYMKSFVTRTTKPIYLAFFLLLLGAAYFVFLRTRKQPYRSLVSVDVPSESHFELTTYQHSGSLL